MNTAASQNTPDKYIQPLVKDKQKNMKTEDNIEHSRGNNYALLLHSMAHRVY